MEMQRNLLLRLDCQRQNINNNMEMQCNQCMHTPCSMIKYGHWVDKIVNHPPSEYVDNLEINTDNLMNFFCVHFKDFLEDSRDYCLSSEDIIDESGKNIRY